MVDTVWMKLTLVNGEQRSFMFGPTGIVNFGLSKNKSTFIESARGKMDFVKENPDIIFDMIRKFRKPKKKVRRSK